MEAQSKIAEIRVSKLTANIAGTVVTILLCVAGIALAQMLPHHVGLAPWQGLAFVLCFLILLPAHEGLHALGLRLYAGVRWRDIRFGVMWRALVPYCHCTVPIPVSAYKRMVLLPLWISSAVSVALLLLVPAFCFGAFAGAAVGACVGDVWVVFKLRSFSDPLLVLDSPSQIGCDVVSTTDRQF